MGVPPRGEEGGPQNDKKQTNVLRMEFSIVGNLSGLQERFFCLFRSSQLNSRKTHTHTHTHCYNVIKFPDFILFALFPHVGRRHWRSPFYYQSFLLGEFLCSFPDWAYLDGLLTQRYGHSHGNAMAIAMAHLGPLHNLHLQLITPPVNKVRPVFY